MCDSCKQVLEELKALQERVKVLEDARSYVGTVLQDFNCNGYFGRDCDLKGAKVVEDFGLKLTVLTQGRRYRVTEFGSFEEKHRLLQEWTQEQEEGEDDAW